MILDRLPLAALAFGLALLAQAHPVVARDPTIFEMLTGFAAKETCSCSFIVEQTDAYCKKFGVPPGYSVEITIDRAEKTVTAAVELLSRTARFDPRSGCVLDRLP